MTALQVLGIRLEQPHRREELIEALRDAKAFAEQNGARRALAGAIADGGDATGSMFYVIECDDLAALGRFRIALAKAREAGNPPALATMLRAEDSPARVASMHVRSEIMPDDQQPERPSPSVWTTRLVQPLAGRREEALRAVQHQLHWARGLGLHARAFAMLGGATYSGIATSVFYADWEALGASLDRAYGGSLPPLATALTGADPPFTSDGVVTAAEIPL
jgi:hypothetical protein